MRRAWIRFGVILGLLLAGYLLGAGRPGSAATAAQGLRIQPLLSGRVGIECFVLLDARDAVAGFQCVRECR